MADIQIVMEVLGNEGIISATKSTVKLENTIKSLSKSLDSGRISDQQFNTALKELRRTLDNNGKSWQANKSYIDQYIKTLRQAEQAAEQDRIAQERLNQARQRAATVLALQQQKLREEAAAQRAAEAAAKRHADRQLELRMRFQEGYAQFTRQRDAMRSLREAYRSGIITLQQYEAQLARIRAVNQGNVAGTNNLGVAMQQTGYQVGDFMVQIQSGTNPMVAFGQQATQLVGVLYLLPPATLAAKTSILGLQVSISALVMSLGIIIPVATAIGAYFMRMSGNSKKLSDRIDDLEKTTQKLQESFELLEDTELDQKFGDSAVAVRGLASAMLELNSAAQLQDLINSVDKIDEAGKAGTFAKFFKGMAAGLSFGYFGAGAVQADEEAFAKLGFDMSLATFEGYTENLKKLATAGDRGGVVQAFNDFIKDASDNGAELTNQGVLLAREMLRVALATAEVNAQLNGSAKAAKDRADQIAFQADAERELARENKAYEERVREANEKVIQAKRQANEEQVKLLQAQGKYAEATELAVKLAREEARAKVLSSAENETQRRALESQAVQAANLAEQAVRLTEQTRQTKEETKLATKEAENYADAINKGLEKRDQFEQKALTALVGKLKAQGNLLAAEKLEVELAREAAVQRVLSTATTLEGKNALVASAIAAADAAEQAVRLGYETDGIKNDARELEKALNASASAMDRMSSSSLNLHVQIAQAKAEAAALAAGLDVSVARSTAKARETYQAQYLEASGAAQMAGDLDAMEQAQRIYNEQLQGLKVLDTLMQSNAAKKESQKGSSRTTDPIKSGTEYIERVLKKEIDLRKKSALMSDEQRKRAEFEFELRQRIDKYKEKASEKEIQAAMTLYDQAVRLERVGDIIDYSQGQFENFFMTVVDGTTSIEDAFKGMLRNILLEIYKQQVAKPAAEGIGNLLRKGAMAIFGGGQTTASAYGNVFQNGSVKAFADGGIVSSPTFFPMSNGTGLMGEAGPEAIMPLKRGPNGKLGVEASGGQQVVVNQSFNFAANGDESVKKIIAQAAPQIAQMTQKQIMDSRRRGGQMKAAFS